MRLTTFSDYSLRTLIYLGVRPGKLVTIADIAVAYDISANHLMKVVHQLAQSGDIATVRGQHGGLRLARRPEDINIGAVIRRTEPDMHLVPCFGSCAGCRIQSACRLATILDEALAAFLAILDRHTLADLLQAPERIAPLLGIPAEA